MAKINLPGWTARVRQLEQALAAAESRAAAAEAERDEAQREAERWRHGKMIEGDFVCPDALRADIAEAERDEAIAVLRSVQWCAVRWIDVAGTSSMRSCCPVCRALQEKGKHEKDCALAACL